MQLASYCGHLWKDMMAADPQVHDTPTATLGVGDIGRVFAAPAKVFEKVEDTGAYGLAMVILLAITTLVGYIQVQSGLIDRVVDVQTEKNLAQVEKSQLNLVDRGRLKQAMEDVRKQGEFIKTIARLQSVVLTPLFQLASFLLIASLLYACVALTGRKPEFHTLMSICVYAGFIELFAYMLTTAMMFYYRTIEIDTSLGALGPAGEPTFLAAVDPFRIWYWVLLGLGLITTRQLSRRMAIVVCLLMCLCTMGVRVAMEYGMHA